MQLTLDYISQLAGYAATIGAFLFTVFKFSKRVVNWVRERMSLMQTIKTSLDNLTADVALMKKELQHNGGSSLKDYIYRLESELIKNEKRQKALVQDLSYGTFETDQTGKVVHVNRTYCRITGRTPDELMGFGWVSCITSEERDEIDKDWHQTILENREWNDSFSFILPTTTGVIKVNFTATPMFNTKNALIGYFGTVVPI